MIEKKIWIRADGNAKIGAGHLMRCLTIADALPDKEMVLFICADEESASIAQERGYDTTVLFSDYKDMEGELTQWKKYLKDAGVGQKVIVVDSYYVTNAYLTKLRKYGRIVLFDDMAQDVKNTDILINYNAFAQRKEYEALGSMYQPEFLVGGKYIPVRKEFCDSSYVLRKKVENILITTGGGDFENIAGQILNRLWQPGVRFHVVTGRFNPHYEKLLSFARENTNVSIYHDVKDMAGLMKGCDLAVTAGGTTVYELSAMGVPFVCFSYAQNQKKLTEYIGKQCSIGYAGDYLQDAEGMLTRLKKNIEKLVHSYEMRKNMVAIMKQVTDGQGAGRLAARLLSEMKMCEGY